MSLEDQKVVREAKLVLLWQSDFLQKGEEGPDERLLEVLVLLAAKHQNKVLYSFIFRHVAVIYLVLKAQSWAVDCSDNVGFRLLGKIPQKVLDGKCLTVLEHSVSVEAAHV